MLHFFLNRQKKDLHSSVFLVKPAPSSLKSELYSLHYEVNSLKMK